MNTVSKALNGTKNFVVNHKTSLIVFTTATATAVLSKKVFGAAYDTATEFIAEKGLAQEFADYIPKK